MDVKKVCVVVGMDLTPGLVNGKKKYEKKDADGGSKEDGFKECR